MQAAINEVHAIYVSSDVHSGWDNLESKRSLEAARIRPKPRGEKVGGHAFCLVGYTPEGFIVQNSWGPKWGYHGFGLLPYDEWTTYGFDAWVLALGAPMLSVRSPASRTTVSLQERSALRAPIKASAVAAGKRDAVTPWIDGEEALHTIFIGHDGLPDRELVEASDAADGVRRVVEEGIVAAAKAGTRHVAIYAHGGLNNREAALTRARIMGPWLEANGIFPIFVIWQTGFLESAEDILKVVIGRLGLAGPERVEGWFVDKIRESKDRGFELTAREVGVKAIWENMKSRGVDSSKGNGAMQLAAGHLNAALAKITADGGEVPSLHLLGHSAGAILLGSFLADLKGAGIAASSLHLWAPACTVSFANATYGDAFADGTINPKKAYASVLTDENELGDACVPVAYSKSLLYLVSRALEPDHKTPVLGLQKAWKGPGRRPPKGDDLFSQPLWSDLTDWDKVSGSVTLDEIAATAVPTLRENGKVETIPASHGSFDNNLDVINTALRRMLGRKPELEVTNLKGF
jgi:hypothetical protein